MWNSLFPIYLLSALFQLRFSLVLDEYHSVFVVYKFKVLLAWNSDYPQDHDDLVGIGVSWEQGCSLKKFSEDAAYRPHVQTLVVAFVKKTDFWRSIPPCDHIGCLLEKLIDLFSKPSAESEVTNFKVAVRIDENVTWLEIPVHYVGAMHIQQSSHDLVHEILIVVCLQFLSRVNQLVKVSFHKLGNDVHIVIFFSAGWFLDIN